LQQQLLVLAEVGELATVGLNLKGEFANASTLFQHPHHEQSIKWHNDHLDNKSKESTK
jgi:hypothetical protein